VEEEDLHESNDEHNTPTLLAAIICLTSYSGLHPFFHARPVASAARIASANVVEVEKIDAFEGTPVLDVKPYAPGQGSATGVKVPDGAKPK
jgi:hypothetical protein